MFVGVVDPVRHPVLLSDVTLVSGWGEVVLGHWGVCEGDRCCLGVCLSSLGRRGTGDEYKKGKLAMEGTVRRMGVWQSPALSIHR